MIVMILMMITMIGREEERMHSAAVSKRAQKREQRAKDRVELAKEASKACLPHHIIPFSFPLPWKLHISFSP